MPSSAHDAKRSRLNRRIPFHLFSPPRQAGIRLGIVLQGAQILCSFFPSPAVGKEGPEQQVWSKESIKVQAAIESTQLRQIPEDVYCIQLHLLIQLPAVQVICNLQGGKLEVTQCDLEICLPRSIMQ